MAWLSIFSGIISGIGNIASAVATWYTHNMARSLGRKEVKLKIAEREAEVTDDLLEIAAEPDPSDADLVERMRRGEL